ncbi:S1C family serine protease [Gemmatimonadota bacterium]
MKTSTLVVVLTASLLCLTVRETAAQSPLQSVMDATVTINVVTPDGRSRGSGFIATSDGVIVTAAHVIAGATSGFVKIATGEEYNITGVIVADARRDLALLRIAGFNLPTAEIGNSDEIEVGQRILTVGTPLGLEATVSDGLVSAFRVEEGTRLVQISAPTSPGSSGGPVITDDGKVIGLVVSGISGGGAENLNFALPINYVRGELALASSKIPTPLSAASVQLAEVVPDEPTDAEALPPVNDSIDFEWALLDGVSIYVESNGPGNTKFELTTSYAISLTPYGDSLLQRSSMVRQVGRSWGGTEVARTVDATSMHLSRQQLNHTQDAYIPAQGVNQRVEHSVDGSEAVVVVPERERQVGRAPPGVLFNHLVLAAISALPDPLPESAYIWWLAMENFTLQATRVEFQTREQVIEIRVPRTGRICTRDTRTQDRRVNVVRGTVTSRGVAEERYFLARSPHTPVKRVDDASDYKCIAVPAAGLVGN